MDAHPMDDGGRRVAVTGLGAVSPFGEGVDQLWSGLAQGDSAIRPLTLFDASQHRTRIAGEVPSEVLTRLARAHGSPARATRCDLFALEAAREALAHACLDPNEATGTGVFFGSSTGGMFEGERVYLDLSSEARRNRARVGRFRGQPLGCPAEAVARSAGFRGPVETVASACAAATMALEAALSSLLSGECVAVLAGGADALCELTYGGFNSLRAVADEPCRPFRADRAGLSLGEGAGVLVLETLASARGRGASVLAELVGAGSSCDAHHMTAPEPTGAGAAIALRAALADADVEPDDVNMISAHGTGTPHNDEAEYCALEAVFGERARKLPLTATKGSVGHILGACGGLEAVAAVRALVEGSVPPTPGGGEIDTACPVDLVLGAPLPLSEPAIAVSLNLAFGGANAAIVLRRADSAGMAGA